MVCFRVEKENGVHTAYLDERSDENDFEDLMVDDMTDDESDEIIDQSSATCTGELITDEDTYYVEIDAVGDTEEYDSVDYDDVYFC